MGVDQRPQIMGLAVGSGREVFVAAQLRGRGKVGMQFLGVFDEGDLEVVAARICRLVRISDGDVLAQVVGAGRCQTRQGIDELTDPAGDRPARSNAGEGAIGVVRVCSEIIGYAPGNGSRGGFGRRILCRGPGEPEPLRRRKPVRSGRLAELGLCSGAGAGGIFRSGRQVDQGERGHVRGREE